MLINRGYSVLPHILTDTRHQAIMTCRLWPWLEDALPMGAGSLRPKASTGTGRVVAGTPRHHPHPQRFTGFCLVSSTRSATGFAAPYFPEFPKLHGKSDGSWQ